MRHVIRRQVMEVSISKKMDFFGLQQYISRLYHERISSVLERVFNDLVPDDRLIRLDHLVLDIGQIRESDLRLGKDLPQLESLVRAQLRELISGSAEVRNQQVVPATMGPGIQWMYYMEHGHLDWQTAGTDDGWYRDVLESFAVDYHIVSALRRLIGTNPYAVKRISYQHTTLFLTSLVGILTAARQTRLAGIIREMALAIELTGVTPALPPAIPSGNIHAGIWMQALQLAAAEKVKTEQQLTFALTDLILTRSQQHQILSLQKLTEQFPVFGPMLADNYRSKPAATNPVNPNPGTAGPEHIREDMAGRDYAGNGDPNQQLKGEGIYVTFAGLVLLHPFLNSFFKRLELVRDGSFISTYTHQKALHLLFYLGTGNTGADEYELAVPKVLCAYPMDEPVVKDMDLSEAEKAECMDMLQAVIEQWTILKSTSPAGLQEGFLKRDGRLSVKDGRTSLLVERGSIDMLLDHLPWNLGIIKLPWMVHMLNVDWR
ncbi:MAG: hypothetical protein EOO09_03305 [Chitinophagaceae bacterium]|nr:MAG: hypothetical protein EOO09_03305 [Chitinophagaceae bacterium]